MIGGRDLQWGKVYNCGGGGSAIWHRNRGHFPVRNILIVVQWYLCPWFEAMHAAVFRHADWIVDCKVSCSSTSLHHLINTQKYHAGNKRPIFLLPYLNNIVINYMQNMNWDRSLTAQKLWTILKLFHKEVKGHGQGHMFKNHGTIEKVLSWVTHMPNMNPLSFTVK